MRCAFTQNRGYYRAMLVKGEPSAGWWVRPSGATEDRNDPGGSGQPFAGRVELRKSGADEWRGDRAAARGPLQSLSAHLSQRRGRARRRVSQSGPQFERRRVVLPRQPRGRRRAFPCDAPTDGTEIRQEATLLRSPDRLKISWKDLGAVLELTRREPAQAAGRISAAAGRTEVRLSQAAGARRRLDDCRTRRDVGLDDAALARLVQRLIDDRPVRPRRAADSFAAGRTARQAGAGGIFLRLLARDAARHPLGRQDVLIDHARRSDAARREDLAADADLRAARSARAVRESGSAQGAHHARAPDDPHSGLDCDDNNPDSLGNEGTMTHAAGAAGLVEVHARPATGLRPRHSLRVLLGQYESRRRRVDDRDPHLAARPVRPQRRASAAVRPLLLEHQRQRRGLPGRRCVRAPARSAEDRPAVSGRRRLERQAHRQPGLGHCVDASRTSRSRPRRPG